MATAKKPGQKSKWDDRFILRVYLYKKAGMSDNDLAPALGVSPPVLQKWLKTKPAFKESHAEGMKVRHEEGSFREYVYKRLPADLKETWDRINLCESSPSGVARVEALLAEAGTTARQNLFLYALVDANFNPSEACRKVGISKATLDYWCASDPDFAKLADEIHWHKGNFFESSLVDAVKGGDVPSILFANKTFNRDRGYGESVKQINKTVTINKTVKNEITIDLSSLSIEKRKQILCVLKGPDNPVIEVRDGQVLEIGGTNGDGHGTPQQGSVE